MKPEVHDLHGAAQKERIYLTKSHRQFQQPAEYQQPNNSTAPQIFKL